MGMILTTIIRLPSPLQKSGWFFRFPFQTGRYLWLVNGGLDPNHLHPTGGWSEPSNAHLIHLHLGGEDLLVRGAFDLLGLAQLGWVGWVVGLVGLVQLDFTSLVVEKYETYSPNGSFIVESQKKNSIKQIHVEGWGGWWSVGANFEGRPRDLELPKTRSISINRT